MRNIMEHAACYDVTKKYERLNMLGKGKFSTVYLCHPQEIGDGKDDEMLAMKFIDKQ
jgi:predicted Ser/Thr protein kinase